MSKTTEPRAGAGIVQQAWAPSVVLVGDRITGRSVSVGGEYTGTVAEVFGPIRSPDCGGYRYRLVDTGAVYWNNTPVEPYVYASGWADVWFAVHGTEHTAELYAALADTDSHVFVAGENASEAWCIRCDVRSRIRGERSVLLRAGTPCPPSPGS